MDDSATWDGREYSVQAGHHRAFDDWFLDRLRPAPGDVVVDLGCGSGEFTATLAGLDPGGTVIGVDADPSMLEAAQRHDAPNLTFVESPAQRVDHAVEPGSVDVVISRAMLHWLPVDTYLDVFSAVRRILRPGGRYHSESAGAGNVAGLTALITRVAGEFGLEPPPPFPDAGVVFDMVERSGLEVLADGVRTIAQRRPFARADALGLLRTQASVALTRDAPGATRDDIVAALTSRVEELRREDGTYDQTFVRLEILATRPARDR